MFNPLKYFRNRTVGLALGSGGAKGISHIAVIDYLKEEGIPIHMIAGSSIGAVIGALYAAGTLDRFRNDLLAMKKKDFLKYFDPVLSRSGLIRGRGFLDLIGGYIPPQKRIEDLSIPLTITATDYNGARSVLFRSGNVLDALRASISIPGVFLPVRYRDTVLIDGGVANPLPVDIVRSMGAGRVIAVNLHPDVTRKTIFLPRPAKPDAELADPNVSLDFGTDDNHDVEKGEGKGQSWFTSVEKWFTGVRKKRDGGTPLPSIFEIITQSVDIMEYTNTLNMLKYNPPDVLVEPRLLDMGSLDFTEASRAIDEGRQACIRVRGKLLRRVKLWV